MDFSAAISAGLIAGGTMVALLYLGAAAAPTQIRLDLLRILGSVVLKGQEEEKVYKGGSMVQAVAGIAVALVYIGIIEATGLSSVLAAWGLLLGVVHYLLAGAALGLLPRLRNGQTGNFAGELSVVGFFPMGGSTGQAEAAGSSTVTANYTRATAVGFLVVHVVFGVMVCGLYQAFGRV